MKFNYKKTKFETFILIYIAISLIVCVLLCFFRIFELFGMYSTSVSLDVVTAITCVIGLTIALMLLTIRYKITDKLSLKLGFIDLLGKKVQISNVLNTVEKDGKLYLSYVSNGFDPVIVQINIDKKYFDTFVKELKARNNNIVESKYEDSSSK